MMITSELYILYGFLGFISLLLITILGVLYGQGRAIGRLEGQIGGLSQQMQDMSTRIDGVETSLTGRVDGVETSLTGRVDGVETSIDGVETSLRRGRDQPHRPHRRGRDQPHRPHR